MTAVTEKEAGQLACPFRFRGVKLDVEGTPRAGALIVGCVGSVCMAWRWRSDGSRLPPRDFGKTDAPPPRGFCGLAGRPE